MTTKMKPRHRQRQRLSDVPSRMIRQALGDLRKCMRLKSVAVDMSTWVSLYEGKCHVCLAGACMYQRNGVRECEGVNRIRGKLWGKMCALDDFRLGRIAYGLYQFGKGLPNGCPYYHSVTSFEEDPDRFFRDMRRIADILESHGL